MNMEIKKVAIILKGAVGKKSGGYGNTTNVKSDNYVDYKITYKCLKKYIIEQNKNYQFDFYIHCWNTDLQTELVQLYNPKKYIFEENSQYEKIFKENIPNGQSISQISQSLSIKKSIELMESSNIDYEYIIITRPDIAVWENIKLIDYHNENIYIEEYKNGNGDMLFIMNRKNASKFKFLYDSTLKDNPAYEHRFIKNYINKYMKQNVFSNIFVGKDIEVLNKISNEKLKILNII